MLQLVLCSPFPPAQNGIADYAASVVSALSGSYEITVCTPDPFANVPPGVRLLDAAQVFRIAATDAVFIHQIGNNADHIFVRDLACHRPGIVVIHDLRLLWLYQQCGFDRREIAARLQRSNSYVGRARAHSFLRRGGFQSFDYMLFDMLDELVEKAQAIVVHSDFARRHIVARFGEAVASKTTVIPHFAFAPPAETRDQARLRLGIDPQTVVVATYGFATRAKRYDIVAGAVAALAERRRDVLWVQAGPVRPSELDLESIIRAHPALEGVTRLTGYLTDRDLGGYIAAADIAINLRYPSVGESSGSLSRALAAGIACVVTDTAAYRELPDEAVIKLPVGAGADELAAVLVALVEDPNRIARMSDVARRYATETLSIKDYIKAFRSVIEHVRRNLPVKARDLPVWAPYRAEAPEALGPIPLAEVDFNLLGRKCVGYGADDVEIELTTIDTEEPCVTFRFTGRS
jgi:glycosyltransferase involved in cell wall biosynthesis